MTEHYRTQGFVLKKDDLGEADQVFSIFTKDFGKLKITAKAVRKIKSKLRAGIGLFYLSEVEFIQGKNHKTLTDAAVITKFENTRQDLEKLKTASLVAKAADDLIKGEEKDEQIWELLSEVFDTLNNYSLFTVHCSLMYYYFVWNLLSILGYQIDLYNCAYCQKKLVPQKLFFNPEQGIICGDCQSQGDAVLSDIIKILRIFLNRDWQTLSRLKITDSHKKSLEKISEDYLLCYQKRE